MLPAFRIETIQPGPEASAYLAMTFPIYWSRLLGRAAGLPLRCLAARADEPLGFALAEVQPDATSVRLLSLFVTPTCRKQGLGTTLVRQLEDTLRQQGVREVFGAYQLGLPSVPAIETILGRCGWSSPTPYLLLVRVGPDAIPTFRTLPSFRRRRLPAGYTFGFWTETTPAEHAEIVAWMERGVVPRYLNPFADAELIEPQSSLTLRHEGRLVGLLVTHRVAPHVVRYSCLFVHPDVAIKGLGLYLSLEGLHRLTDANEAGVEVLCATYAGTSLADFWQRRWLASLPQAHVSLSSMAGKHLTESSSGQPWQPRRMGGLFDE